MKKFLALLLAVMMILSLSVVALAANKDEDTEEDAEEVTEYSVDDMDEDLYDGEWVCVGDSYYMYLPTDWTEVDTTDDENATNVVYALTNDDETAVVLVEFYDEDAQEEALGSTVSSVDDLTEAFDAAGTEYVVGTVNDIDVVCVADEEQDAAFLYIVGEDGLYIVTVSPVTDDDYVDIFNNIFNSIMTVEDFEDSDFASEVEDSASAK